LYDPADPDGLALALERLADPGLRATLGRAARDRAVKHLSWEQHCRKLVQAIEAARSAAS
jgi:glycosyltransferase involved in cell wall biosynthesis